MQTTSSDNKGKGVWQNPIETFDRFAVAIVWKKFENVPAGTKTSETVSLSIVTARNNMESLGIAMHDSFKTEWYLSSYQVKKIEP